MKCTGVVTKVDDLGRVLIPREIRRNLKIDFGEPLGIFVNKEQQMVCFQKYIGEKSISERCKEIVNQYKKRIISINLFHYTTTIETTDGQVGQATWNEKGDFDINIGIAYALVNAGYFTKEKIEED